MSDYLQPDFYRFNSDSLKLVSWIKNRTNLGQAILDLGAGCGVIGLELSLYYQPNLISFVELQEDFRASLEMNVKNFLPPSSKSEITIAPFSTYRGGIKFQLIACNPPYYFSDSGQSSKDHRRGLARTFLKDNWHDLIDCIDRNLSHDGKAFLVVKNDEKIKNKINQALKVKKLTWRMEEDKDLAFWELFRLNVD